MNQIDADSYDRKALEIKNWLARHPRTPVILASRQQHYSAHRQLKIPLVEVLPLDDDRIRRFVINFLGEQLGSKLLALLGPAAGMDSSSRDRLANNPFHLILMCTIFKQNQEQVPFTRGALLREFTSLIYRRQELTSGQVDRISAASLKQALEILAFGIVSSRRSTSIDEAWAAKRLKRQGTDLQELMRLGESYRLLSKSGRFFEFDHQLLLEYFAAEYLLDHLDQLDEYLPVPVFIHGKRMAQPFDDALYMLVELDDVSRVLGKVADRDPFQAAELLSLAAEAEVEPAVRETVVGRLMEAFEHTNEAHGIASEQLVKLGSAAVDSLQRLFETGHKKARRRAISTLSQISTLPALETVIDALQDRNRWVRRDAMQIMSSLDEGERRLIETFVRELAERSEEERETVAKSLLKCWLGHYDDLARQVAEVSGIECVGEEPDDEPEITEDDEGPLAAEPVLEEEDIDLAGRTLPFQTSDFEEAPSEQKLHRWLRGSIGDRSWPKVWNSVWRANPGDPELKRFADRWLNEASPHPNWGFIWAKIWEAFPEDSKLTTQARAWLSQAPAFHPSWSYPWITLFKEAPKDPDLEAWGRRWLEKAPIENKAWGYVWPALWEANRGDADLAAMGRRWLAAATCEHRSWGFIWLPLWEAAPEDELTQLANKWLAEVGPAHISWRDVWAQLWKAGLGAAELEELAALARAWLRVTPVDHRDWGFVWSMLQEADFGRPEADDAIAPLLGQAREWLARASSRHPNWAFVWSKTWGAYQKDPGLETLARSWLSQSSASHPAWGFPWTALWKTYPADPDLETWGRRWLSQASVEHKAWGYVWPRLWDAHPGDEELESHGRRWLAAAPRDHQAWAFIWSPLREAHPDDAELDQIARTWLASAPFRHGFWAAAWQSMWASSPGDAELEALARDWLEAVPATYPEWGYVWPALLEAQPEERDPNLEAVGRRWLSEAPIHHKAWGFIWPKLWELHPKDGDLLRHGRRWLEEAPPGHQAWGFIWALQLEASPDDSELKQLGRTWLAAVDASHKAWGLVWVDLWKAARDDDEELGRMAREWLQHTLPHANWGYVWSQMWEAHPDDPELEACARSWLAQTPADLPLWGYPWTALWDAHPGDPELEALGRRWLSAAPVEHKSWGYVWPKLWEKLNGDEELEGQGRRWLQETPPEHEAWGFVWPALKAANPADDQLSELGRRWLQQASLDHGSWPRVWQMLWTTPSMRDATMAELGQIWLEHTFWTNGAWPHVWNALWLHDPTPEFKEMGCRWLLEVPADHRPWFYVWRPLLPVASRQPQFVEASVRWLRATDEDHERWGEVSAKLVDQGLLPDDLTEHIRRRLDLSRLDEIPQSSDEWGRMWGTLWAVGADRKELAQRALPWLSGRTYGLKSWPFVWNSVYKGFGIGPDLILHGKRWAARPSCLDKPGWSLVWAGVIQSSESARPMLPLGWEWMKRPMYRQSWSWPLIWLRLWESDPASRDRLTEMALSWFDGQRTHHGEDGRYWPASEAWLKVWPEAVGDQRLVAWGKAFLEGQSKNRDWQAVALALWTLEPRPLDLRDMIRQELAANPEDTSDWDITQLVEDRP